MTMKNGELILIGAIAKSYGVSENCIRRMEADGLVKPAYISPDSGYRYYNSSDIVQIGTVLTLRSFGFTNKDIRLFLEHPDELSVLSQKLQEKQQALANLIAQLDRRLKTEESYKCGIVSFRAAYYYTKEMTMAPSLAACSDIISKAQFEAIHHKLSVDYAQPPVIETTAADYRTFRPREEQKLLFHIPLRERPEGREATFLPQTRAVEVKWSYPFTEYTRIIPVIDQFFRLFSLKQAGTLRATFNMGMHSAKNADVSSTVMHMIIPVE